MDIALDDLSDGAIARLLNAHMQQMHKYSPPESIHALDSQQLKDPKVTFWGARIDGVLVGCGALKAFGNNEAEIKSMKTADTHLRHGVGAKILQQIIIEAKSRRYCKVSLETGSDAAFAPAIALYQRFGFVECEPFGEYKADPYSRFFTLAL